MNKQSEQGLQCSLILYTKKITYTVAALSAEMAYPAAPYSGTSMLHTSHFAKHGHPMPENSVLLVLENHSSHTHSVEKME
jgi:hypothetical protein